MSSGPTTRQRLRRGLLQEDQTVEPEANPNESQKAKGTRRGKQKQKPGTPTTTKDVPKSESKTLSSTNVEGRSRRRKQVQIEHEAAVKTENDKTVVNKLAQNEKQVGVRGRMRKRGAKTEEKVENKQEKVEDKNSKAVLKEDVKKEPLDEESLNEKELPKGRQRVKKEVLRHSEVSGEIDHGEELKPVTNASKTRGRGKVAPRAATGRRKQEAKVEPEPIKEDNSVAGEQAVPSKRPRRGRQVKKEDDAGRAETVIASSSSSAKQAEGEQKLINAEVETEAEPAKVSVDSRNAGRTGKCVGAHCSVAGGLWNAVTDAVAIKAKSFALFLRSQRQWHAKPLEDNVAAKFREACKQHGFPPHLILPHGSYLLNCGSPNPETLFKSRDTLMDELLRCEKLGLTLYNFHPGSTCGAISVEECLDKIGESINMALAKTSGVVAVIENMSCQGNTIGGRFEELRGIIDRVDDKSRIGVCLDTCHAFAAGYDLSTQSGFDEMMDEFERIVGFKYLKGMHINDSKGEVGCHLDCHENIGKGNIGLDGFRRVMNDPRLDNIPLILETPPDFGYDQEIKILNSLVD